MADKQKIFDDIKKNIMQVKIRKENCLIAKYIYINGDKYQGPSIGEMLVRRTSSGYSLSAIILAWIRTN